MIPERYGPHAYALMRIVFGLMFLTYGLQKFGLLGGQMAPLLSWPFGIAGIIETACGLLIALGVFTKPAAFVASGEMAAAYFLSHQFAIVNVGANVGGLPVQNGGIQAVLFCFGFLYIATRGSGIMSFEDAGS